MDVGTGILNSNKLNYILVVINNIIYSLIKNFPMKKEVWPFSIPPSDRPLNKAPLVTRRLAKHINPSPIFYSDYHVTTNPHVLSR
jgi:hypothetical protein